MNSGEDILSAFKIYYETAELEATTDPNLIYDLRAKLDGGWQRFKESGLKHRSIFQVALLGNVVSLGIAVIAGLLFKSVSF